MSTVAPFVAMPPDLWPEVFEHLPLPLNDKQAHFDLRWLWDQGRGVLPSRKDLAERWGWTRDEVRTLLRNPQRWMDPYSKHPYPDQRKGTSRRALTQRDPARPDLTQTDPDDTDETEEPATPDPVRPSVTQADPASPQRGDLPPSPAPSPSPSDSMQGERAAREVPFDQFPDVSDVFLASDEAAEVIAACRAASKRHGLPPLERQDLRGIL